MGRPLTDRRTTNSVTKSTGYTYNLDGSMATLTYPSGRVVTYTVNAAGRAISAVDVANSINFATGASYTPPGALASLTNGASLVSTLYYNSRLQPCRISVRSAGVSPANCGDTSNIGNVLDFSYNFALGTADNGNVSEITNNRDTTRSQSFTYDTLNRIATAKTTATSGANCWGETFSYDVWANLLSIGGLSGYFTCTQEMLNVGETVKNQISGNTYDAAGNLTASPPPASASYAYDAENRLTTTAGVTYTYDGDGKRVQKSNGKLYWYGAGSDPLDETDLAGNTNNASFYEYVFFSGKRIARRDFSGNAVYYFSDHLGTARVMTNNAGTVLDDSDFYPFGGERAVLSSSGNSYKFTTKERDSESTLDNFGARYFGSSLGRFMSPDPLGILSAETTSPQSLNLYSYVQNNPVNAVDPDGLDCVYVNDNSVSVVRGDCKSETDSGIFVNGTININSFTYNSQTQSLGFNFRNDDTGSFGVGVIAGVALSGGVSDADRFNAVVHGMQIAAPGVNLAANGLRAFGFVVAAPMMVIAECTAGSSLCTKGNIAMAILPEVGALRETALLLKEGAAAGKAAEILQKGGGMARAAKDFESLQGAEKVIGSTKIKTLADGTRAVLYQSKGGAPTLALQDAAGRTVTKIRY